MRDHSPENQGAAEVRRLYLLGALRFPASQLDEKLLGETHVWTRTAMAVEINREGYRPKLSFGLSLAARYRTKIHF